MNKDSVRVLLVEDDEDDYVLFRDVVSEVKHLRIELTWVNNFQHALVEARKSLYDIYIVDYLLGEGTGIELLQALKENAMEKPFILLTGHGDHDIDVQAMKEGAADYLEKEMITPQLLERVIRYSIQKFFTMELLRESEKRLRQLSIKLINTQEDERKRIATELHDSIGSNLAAVKFEIQKQMTDLKKRKENFDIDHQFKNLTDIVQQTIDETRRICHNLRPSVLDDLGVVIAIKWYCRNFPQSYSNISIDADLKISEKEVPEPLKVVIFRVMQEAFTNVAKHSGADKVKLVFEKTDDKIILTIRDNGRGFDISGKRPEKDCFSGMGLMSMKERVGNSGGSFLISSAKTKGTEVQAIWPVLSCRV
ncbi:MAG: response regulator [Desulfobacteraceae bacterium]|nr:MAG: response regulator [Desulfobacteraceae bacterium]